MNVKIIPSFIIFMVTWKEEKNIRNGNKYDTLLEIFIFRDKWECIGEKEIFILQKYVPEVFFKITCLL